MATILRSPLLQRIVGVSALAAILATSEANLLTSTLAPLTPAPFSQKEWTNPSPPRPRSVDLLTIADASEFWLLKDTFFGLPGEVLDYTWPNPLLVGRLHVGQIGIPLQALLSPASSPAPFFSIDQPNPRLKPFPSDLRSYIDPSEIWLQGTDLFFTSPGRGPAYDWPNPTRKTPLVVTSLTSTFYYIIDDNVPFTPVDFPNPLIKQASIDLRTLLNSLQTSTLAPIVVPPVYFTGWTNPLVRQYPLDLRTFLNPAETQLFGKDTFFGGPGQPILNLQWPNPRGYIGVIDLKTETLSLLSTTLKPAAPPPSTGHDLILVDGRLAKHLSGIIYVFLN